jgi:hypothetical protein
VNYLGFENTPTLESAGSSLCGEYGLTTVYSQHRVRPEGHIWEELGCLDVSVALMVPVYRRGVICLEDSLLHGWSSFLL